MLLTALNGNTLKQRVQGQPFKVVVLTRLKSNLLKKVRKFNLSSQYGRIKFWGIHSNKIHRRLTDPTECHLIRTELCPLKIQMLSPYPNVTLFGDKANEQILKLK